MMLTKKNVCVIMVPIRPMEDVMPVLTATVSAVLSLVALLATKGIIWMEVFVNLVLLIVLTVDVEIPVKDVKMAMD